jgi:hypothetical protein
MNIVASEVTMMRLMVIRAPWDIDDKVEDTVEFELVRKMLVA